MLVFVSLCDCSHDNSANDQLNIFHDSHLRVAASVGSPGCFVVGGHQFGFCHDLLADYAKTRNLDLEFVENLQLNSLSHRLKLHLSDIGIFLSCNNNLNLFDKMSAVTVGSTYFVMLARDSGPADNTHISQIVEDRNVVISSAFQNTLHYDALLDSLSRARLYVSPKHCRELALALQSGEYDFMICEASDAVMAAELVKNLRVVFKFDDSIDINLVFPHHAGLLYEDFCQWWNDYSTSPDFELLQQAYFNNGFKKRLRAVNRRTRILNGISIWDDVIKHVGQREGVDWRLLSAIAFEESMFRSDVTAASGATGLMQIMPITARHFNVDQESLADPETNVTIAAKLLKSIENSFDFPDSVALDDKLSIILASYNCGQKTVSDALAIASATGRNPYSWNSVADCLKLMGSDDFHSDSISFRRFKGFNETASFVASVMDRFDSYCRSIQ